MAGSQVHTYHCICSELVVATFAPLQSLPKRTGDKSAICKITKSELPVPGAVVLSGSTFDESKPAVMYLLPGSLMSTEEMKTGKNTEEEIELAIGGAG